MKEQVRDIVPNTHSLPPTLRLIVLTEKPIFPGIFTPMVITSERDKSTVTESLNSDGHIGLVLSKNGADSNAEVTDLHKLGTIAKIVKKINLPDGDINIFISTIQRFKIVKVVQNKPTFVVAVKYFNDRYKENIEIRAMARSILGEIKQISEGNPLFSEEMRLNMVNIDQPSKIADFVTSILNIQSSKQQEILETVDIYKRLEKVLVLLKQEKEVLRIQKKIHSQINEKIENRQREFFLREQLKVIQEELGIASNGRNAEYQQFQKKIEKFELNDELREQIENELNKFKLMESNTSEYQVTRNYLETIVSMPWNNDIKGTINLHRAQRILQADHYGLQDVKERILEFLAVQSRKNDLQGSIVLLVGPPGVGKTSIGKSVARSLGRKFFRFSVGGMRDEAEIKGHRRTYVGAMPGKIIQGLKIVKSKQVVFMIDEVDKLGLSYQGDPASALLEVLDPEQNHAFRDHYLDLPFDLSQIFFILTANSTDTIPRALLDRMEVIPLSGYIAKEKIAIAQKYIIPKSLANNGIDKNLIQFPKITLTAIAENYAREAGMRGFEKAINRINRKVVKKLVIEDESQHGTGKSGKTKTDSTRREKLKVQRAEPLVLSPEDLKDYLGLPRFRSEELKIMKPGMVTGLAWTNFGGDTLTIEVVATPGKGQFKLTGQLGEVMQESANIAYTWVQSQLLKENDESSKYHFFDKQVIHIHIPAGATPKDGPSAGITMASALLSLLYKKTLKRTIAMTGELSLSGSVLPIGGLKEKIIAAKRSKIKTVIYPLGNEPDLNDIPKEVKQGISFYPVTSMEEISQFLFKGQTLAPDLQKQFGTKQVNL